MTVKKLPLVNSPLLFWVTYCTSRVLGLIVLNRQIVSFDHYYWIRIIRAFDAGLNPYVHTTHLNWPPLWPAILYCLGALAEISGLRASFLIRVFLILIECGLIVVTYAFLTRLLKNQSPYTLLLIYVICPIPILLNVVHCNFDVLLAFWVMLGLYQFCLFAEKGNPSYWLNTCLFFGLAILTKTIPVILAPILVYRIKSISKANVVYGGALLLLPTVISVSFLYYFAPDAIMTKVISYRSYGGYYGVTGLLELCGLSQFLPAYSQYFTYSLALVLAATTAFFYRLKLATVQIISLSAGALFLFIPTLGSGYGTQYANWFLPIIALILGYAERDLKIAIYLWLLIASLTYVFEYAVFTSHGNLILYFFRYSTETFNEVWASKGGQTLLRLPQFIASCLLLYLILKELRSRVLYVRAKCADSGDLKNCKGNGQYNGV